MQDCLPTACQRAHLGTWGSCVRGTQHRGVDEQRVLPFLLETVSSQAAPNLRLGRSSPQPARPESTACSPPRGAGSQGGVGTREGVLPAPRDVEPGGWSRYPAPASFSCFLLRI